VRHRGGRWFAGCRGAYGRLSVEEFCEARNFVPALWRIYSHAVVQRSGRREDSCGGTSESGRRGVSAASDQEGRGFGEKRGRAARKCEPLSLGYSSSGKEHRRRIGAARVFRSAISRF